MLNWWLITIFAAGCFAAVTIRRVLIGEWWRHLFGLVLVLSVSGQASAEYNPNTSTVSMAVGIFDATLVNTGTTELKGLLGVTATGGSPAYAWWGSTPSTSTSAGASISTQWSGWVYLGKDDDGSYWWGSTVSYYYPAQAGDMPLATMSCFIKLHGDLAQCTVYRDAESEVAYFKTYTGLGTVTGAEFRTKFATLDNANMTITFSSMPARPTTRPSVTIATSQPYTSPTTQQFTEAVEEMLDEVQDYEGPPQLKEWMDQWRNFFHEIETRIEFPELSGDFFQELKNYLILKELPTEFGVAPAGGAAHNLTFDYKLVLDQISARTAPLLVQPGGLIVRLANIIRATLILLLYWWGVLKFYHIVQRAFGTVAHVVVVNS